jgi:tetrahydromethanopterin S-methyltransferase subunit F
MEIIEIKEVPVGAPDIPTVTAIQAYAANLNWIC